MFIYERLFLQLRPLYVPGIDFYTYILIDFDTFLLCEGHIKTRDFLERLFKFLLWFYVFNSKIKKIKEKIIACFKSLIKEDIGH